jgi:hypothetical protein
LSQRRVNKRLSRAARRVILVVGVVVMRALVVTVSVTVLWLAGCSDTSGGTPGQAPQPEVTATAVDTTEPAPEPTGAESTQPQQKKPSISIVSLPIGPGAQANQPSDESKQCVGVTLTGLDVPNGTTLTFGSPSLGQDGDYFKIDQSGCGDQGPACDGHQIRSDNQPPCYVGVQQATRDEGKQSTLVIPAGATCASDQDCASIKDGGESQIVFDTRALGGGDPSATPSDG